MLRLLCLPWLILAAVFVFESERVEESAISEQEVKQWFSDQELTLLADFIVQARTVARDDEGEKIQTWMNIEHVYYGPAFLKGQQFLVDSPKKSPVGSGPFQVYPAPEMNDVGIWRLAVRKNRLDAFPRNPLFFDCPIPAFQRDGDDYQTALSFAKAVEEISQLPDRQKKLSRLEQLALSQDSEIGHWATGRVARERPDGIVDFLRSVIANEKSTVAAQVVADEALMELDPKAWQHSNERIVMVKKWVNGKSSLRSALMFDGLSHMMAHESFGIENAKLLDFLNVALLNGELPLNDRLGIAHGFRDYPRQFKDDRSFQDKIFQVLAKVVLKSKDQSVKREAAQTLVIAFSFDSETRQTKLRELMESEDSGEGGRFLRERFDIDAID